MDKNYADTVRLLLAVAPAVFANEIFAMKGGTAINLFVQGMPRLSVDIDVVFVPREMPREQALKAIHDELAAITRRIAPLGLQTRLVRAKELGDTKLVVENETSQVKIEVNVVFRGTVLQHRHAAELPALRWKLANLEAFKKRRPVDFAAQADALDAGLHQTTMKPQT